MRTLLIDFDGTLVDTVGAYYELYQQFLADHGVMGNRTEFDSLNGTALPQFVEMLVIRYGLPGDVEAHINAFYSRAAQIYSDHLPFFPGASHALKCAADKGIRCAIVTSGRHDLVEKHLRSQNMREAFAHIVTPIGLKFSKPDPAIYLRALDIMQCSAKDCLAIEDSHHGVTAALKAGIATIAFGQQWSTDAFRDEAAKGTVTFIRDWHALAERL